MCSKAASAVKALARSSWMKLEACTEQVARSSCQREKEKKRKEKKRKEKKRKEKKRKEKKRKEKKRKEAIIAGAF